MDRRSFFLACVSSLGTINFLGLGSLAHALTSYNQKKTNPDKFEVIILDDNQTEMEFVTNIIGTVFSHKDDEARRLMLQIHHTGHAVCGVYLKEDVENKSIAVTSAARKEGFPLRCIYRAHKDTKDQLSSENEKNIFIRQENDDLFFNHGVGTPIQQALEVDPTNDYFVVTGSNNGFRIKGYDLIAGLFGNKLFAFPDNEILMIRPVTGTAVATISAKNRMLVSSLDDFPFLSRGKGVCIQKLEWMDSLIDLVTFFPEKGLPLKNHGIAGTLKDFAKFEGSRATAGSKFNIKTHDQSIST